MPVRRTPVAAPDCKHDPVPQIDDLLDLTAADLAERVRRGDVRASRIAEATLQRIAARDVRITAFSEVRPDAVHEAEALDALPDDTKAALPLLGVPVAVKQDVDVAGSVTTFGGTTNSRPATADAEVVRRLRAAGAVIVGKTHMAEFGHGPHTEGAWGWTSNPRNLQLGSGGSSGGSAAAVATGMVPIALGTDAGGSVRTPAAWTGVFGLKPSRGRVSAAPHQHLWYMLGQHGPLARSVADIRLALDAISGTVDTDTYRLGPTSREYDPAHLRVGWTVRCPVPGISADHEVGLAVATAAHALQQAGHQVTAKPFTAHGTPLPFLVQADAGIRAALDTVDHPEQAERRNREAATRGTSAALSRALTQTRRIEFSTSLAFRRLDVLLTPVTPSLPQPVLRLSRHGLATTRVRAARTISYASYWNLAGNPALSVPFGTSRSGLPLAIQIVGGIGREDVVLACADVLAHLVAPQSIAWPPQG